ncbi:hypothetical protein Pan153_23470 [Gimesia panareensis]|uniref:YdhG-like domain-containing protein n=1 Tax=Gimesia panareensis TaxID=2527978 RepID=A0A518FMV6_9PLAN|nr:DUF1801 domain-containing protein [Gimesia panareensis]QDV17693.1 hypothetical protein Pan153_23470 [Gimesia panareensis]
MNTRNPEVDFFFKKAKRWQAEMLKLRTTILDCGLEEVLKWGKPCYMQQKSNIVIIQGFKEYCALLFFKGALLKDRQKLLVKPGENTQAGRQLRFTGLEEIVTREAQIKSYIREAIKVEQAGLKVKMKKTSEHPVPEEFQTKLDEMPALKSAFAALTPGRQRAYLLHFSGAKQSKTRLSRIEKCMPRIFEGKGIND